MESDPRSRRRWETASLLLLGALIAQLVWIQGKSTLRIPVGPTTGQQLPAVGEVRTVAGATFPFAEWVNDSERCTLLVAVAANCGMCREMRTTWSDAFVPWSDSVGSAVQVAWLAAPDSTGLKEFYSIEVPNDIHRLVLADGDSMLRRRLGVYAMPTIYLVDAGGRLRFGSMGFSLPPVDSAIAACPPE